MLVLRENVSPVFPQIQKAQGRTIQGMMVRLCSVWPTLSIWCKKFQIEGPSLFAIPSL